MTGRAGKHSAAVGNASSNRDVLRAIGVLVVFFFHLGVAMHPSAIFMVWGIDLDPFGRAALLLFFVHTSFVLMQSMERTERAGGNIVRSFFVRRSLRIYPLSIVCVLGVLLLHIPRSFRSGPFQFPSWGGLIANLLLYQNLTNSASITLPLWTLPYEVQMYALLPLVYLTIRLDRSVRGAVAWFAFATVSAPSAYFLLSSNRAGYVLQFFPAFMAGVVAYKLTSRGPMKRWPSWCWPLFIVGLMGLYGAAITVQHVPIWVFSYRGFFTAGIASLILGGMLPRFNHATNPVFVFITRWIAQHSYGIYLTHMSVMWISFVTLARLAMPIRWLIFVFLSVTVPIACFQLIENPLMQLGRKLSRPVQVSSR